MPIRLREDGMLEWKANPGKQSEFLASTAYECLYGGAAGGGKSEALLIGALRYIHHPGYRALLLRRTFKELEGSLIERSRDYYAGIPGAEYNEGKKTWRFYDTRGDALGAIEFGHCEYDEDVNQYKSKEYQYLGFDELTSFTLHQYTFLLSRLRSSRGLPVRARAATNPGDVGHEWVLARFAPWLIPIGHILDDGTPYEGPHAEPCEVLHYVPEKGQERWVPAGTPGSLTRQFIPAKLADNPVLMENDPGYSTRLEGLDPLTAAQQKEGNWLIKPSPGLLFKRGWMKMVDVMPAEVEQWVRFWDLAATSADPKKKKDPDWTVGHLMGRTREGLWIHADNLPLREDPGTVEATVRNTAQADRELLGKHYAVRMPQDPGQAGKAQAASFRKLLSGFDFDAKPVTGDKVVNFKPYSAQAKGGNCVVVRGAWVSRWMAMLEAFPTKGVHDDDADATSGAFNDLSQVTPAARLRKALQAR